MPRSPRYFLPNMPLHVIQRGNNRAACFHNDQDRAVYLDLLAKSAQRFGVAIHNFVLMTNHIHMLVTPREVNGMSQCMQLLGSRYVLHFNRAHGRTGTLWEGRFRAFMVDSDPYFHTLCRYIEQNPVRAGMVRHCAEHIWSSYQANALGRDIKMLTPHPMYLALGQNAMERCKVYQRLFESPLTAPQLKEVRRAVNKGVVLGRPEFRRQVEARLGIKLDQFEQGGDRKSARFKEQRTTVRSSDQSRGQQSRGQSI